MHVEPLNAVADEIDDETLEGSASAAERAFGNALRMAEQTLGDAQRYVVERVRERPVTAALAGLGAGLLLGVLLSSRAK